MRGGASAEYTHSVQLALHEPGRLHHECARRSVTAPHTQIWKQHLMCELMRCSEPEVVLDDPAPERDFEYYCGVRDWREPVKVLKVGHSVEPTGAAWVGGCMATERCTHRPVRRFKQGGVRTTERWREHNLTTTVHHDARHFQRPYRLSGDCDIQHRDIIVPE